MKRNIVTKMTAALLAAAAVLTETAGAGVEAKADVVDVLYPSQAMAKGFKLVGKNVHVGGFGDYMIDIPDNWVPWENESMIFYGYTDCVKQGYWIAKNDSSQSDDCLVYFSTGEKAGWETSRTYYFHEFSQRALKDRILSEDIYNKMSKEEFSQYITISDQKTNPAGINYYYGELKIPADVSRYYGIYDSKDYGVYDKYYLFNGQRDVVNIRQQGREHAQNPDFDSMALSLKPYVEPAPEKPKMKLYSKKGAKSIKQIFAIVKKSRSRKEQKKHPDWTLDEYLIGKKVYGKVYKINDEDGKVTIKDRKTKQKIIISTDRFEDMEVGKSYVFKIDSAYDQSKNCIECEDWWND